eukprot:Ihof_evm4s202 gene=Ihof_evmTU4s202
MGIIIGVVFTLALCIAFLSPTYGQVDSKRDEATLEDMVELISKMCTMPCGSHIDYWSTSCGAITSAASRHCSRGGYRISASSCQTHFEPHSRGCGFAMLGCQSECRLQVRECNHGSVGFGVSSYIIPETKDNVQVSVFRTGGYDGDISVQLGICNSPNSTTISWDDKNFNFKVVNVSLPSFDDTPDVVLCLSYAAGGKYKEGMYKELPKLTVKRTRLQGWATFETSYIETYENMKSVYVRMLRKGDISGPLHISLVALYGSATPLNDYERVLPMSIEWSANDNNPITVQIPLVNDEYPEEDETFVLAIRNKQDSMTFVQSPPITTIIILNDDHNPNGLSNLVKEKLHAFQKLDVLLNTDTDEAWYHTVFHHFHPRVLEPGAVIVRHDEVADLVFAVEYGSVESTLVRPLLKSPKFTLPENYPKTIYGPGRVIGLVETLTNSLYRVDVVTREQTKIWIISRDYMHQLAIHYPESVRKVLSDLVKHTVKSIPHKPPIILFPGFMSTRLVAWKYKPCLGFPIEPLDTLWVSVEKIAQTMFSDTKCWLSCLGLAANQADPPDCVVRAMDGMEAITEMVPGVLTQAFTTVFGGLIRYFARELDYTSVHMAAMGYDWRLSPDVMQERDGYFLHLKKRIESLYETSSMAAIVIGHSQGNIVFLHFMRWLEYNYPNDWEDWVSLHIGSFYGLGAPLLGAEEGVHGIMIGSSMGLPFPHSQFKHLALSFGTVPWFNPHNGNASHIPGGKTTNKYRLYDKWVGNIANVTWPNKTTTEYTADDIRKGNLYRDMFRDGNDTRFNNLLNVHMNNYAKQPFNHFADGYSRPPVKHVYMIYGINWDTVISEAFSYPVPNEIEPIVTATHLETKHGLIRDKITGAVVGDNKMGKSGDSTVPYISLSWAMLWHKNI